MDSTRSKHSRRHPSVGPANEDTKTVDGESDGDHDAERAAKRVLFDISAMQRNTNSKSKSMLQRLVAPLQTAAESAIKIMSSPQEHNAVLLGPNGNGKTFTENAILKSTVVSEIEYATQNRHTDFESSIPVKFAKQTLSQMRTPSARGKGRMMKKDEVEIRLTKAISTAKFSQQDGGRTEQQQELIEKDQEESKRAFSNRHIKFQGYVLPSMEERRITTPLPVEIRYGERWALLVFYYGTDQLRRELMLHCGKDAPEDDQLLKAHHEHLALARGCRTLEEDTAGFPHTMDSIALCECVAEACRIGDQSTVEIFAGNGVDRDLDRIHIRQAVHVALGKTDNALQFRVAAVSRVVLFAPCEILKQGLVLHDVPGFDDASSLRQMYVREKIAIAQTVICCSGRNPEATPHLSKFLLDTGYLKRYIDNQDEYNLHWIVCSERTDCPSVVEAQEKQGDIDGRQQFRKLIETCCAAHNLSAQQTQSAVEKAQLFPVYPALMQSLMSLTEAEYAQLQEDDMRRKMDMRSKEAVLNPFGWEEAMQRTNSFRLFALFGMGQVSLAKGLAPLFRAVKKAEVTKAVQGVAMTTHTFPESLQKLAAEYSTVVPFKANRKLDDCVTTLKEQWTGEDGADQPLKQFIRNVPESTGDWFSSVHSSALQQEPKSKSDLLRCMSDPAWVSESRVRIALAPSKKGNAPHFRIHDAIFSAELRQLLEQHCSELAKQTAAEGQEFCQALRAAIKAKVEQALKVPTVQEDLTAAKQNSDFLKVLQAHCEGEMHLACDALFCKAFKMHVLETTLRRCVPKVMQQATVTLLEEMHKYEDARTEHGQEFTIHDTKTYLEQHVKRTILNACKLLNKTCHSLLDTMHKALQKQLNGSVGASQTSKSRKASEFRPLFKNACAAFCASAEGDTSMLKLRHLVKSIERLEHTAATQDQSDVACAQRIVTRCYLRNTRRDGLLRLACEHYGQKHTGPDELSTTEEEGSDDSDDNADELQLQQQHHVRRHARVMVLGDMRVLPREPLYSGAACQSLEQFLKLSEAESGTELNQPDNEDTEQQFNNAIVKQNRRVVMSGVCADGDPLVAMAVQLGIDKSTLIAVVRAAIEHHTCPWPSATETVHKQRQGVAQKPSAHQTALNKWRSERLEAFAQRYPGVDYTNLLTEEDNELTIPELFCVLEHVCVAFAVQVSLFGGYGDSAMVLHLHAPLYITPLERNAEVGILELAFRDSTTLFPVRDENDQDVSTVIPSSPLLSSSAVTSATGKAARTTTTTAASATTGGDGVTTPRKVPKRAAAELADILLKAPLRIIPSETTKKAKAQSKAAPPPSKRSAKKRAKTLQDDDDTAAGPADAMVEDDQMQQGGGQDNTADFYADAAYGYSDGGNDVDGEQTARGDMAMEMDTGNDMRTASPELVLSQEMLPSKRKSKSKTSTKAKTKTKEKTVEKTEEKTEQKREAEHVMEKHRKHHRQSQQHHGIVLDLNADLDDDNGDDITPAQRTLHRINPPSSAKRKANTVETAVVIADSDDDDNIPIAKTRKKSSAAAAAASGVDVFAVIDPSSVQPSVSASPILTAAPQPVAATRKRKQRDTVSSATTTTTTTSAQPPAMPRASNRSSDGKQGSAMAGQASRTAREFTAVPTVDPTTMMSDDTAMTDVVSVAASGKKKRAPRVQPKHVARRSTGVQSALSVPELVEELQRYACVFDLDGCEKVVAKLEDSVAMDQLQVIRDLKSQLAICAQNEDEIPACMMGQNGVLMLSETLLSHTPKLLLEPLEKKLCTVRINAMKTFDETEDDPPLFWSNVRKLVQTLRDKVFRTDNKTCRIVLADLMRSGYEVLLRKLLEEDNPADVLFNMTPEERAPPTIQKQRKSTEAKSIDKVTVTRSHVVAKKIVDGDMQEQVMSQ